MLYGMIYLYPTGRMWWDEEWKIPVEWSIGNGEKLKQIEGQTLSIERYNPPEGGKRAIALLSNGLRLVDPLECLRQRESSVFHLKVDDDLRGFLCLGPPSN